MVRRYLLPRLFALALLLILCSCERLPEEYPPPEQHPPSQESASVPPEWMFLDMADADAPSHFVKDLQAPVNDGWVFTGPSPTLKILAVLTKDLKLRVEFTLWEVAFRDTGPVQLEFRVNGIPLANVRYDSPGPKIFEQPIPPENLAVGEESTVSITIDKPWVSPRNHLQYGFILQRIGFVR